MALVIIQKYNLSVPLIRNYYFLRQSINQAMLSISKVTSHQAFAMQSRTMASQGQKSQNLMRAISASGNLCLAKQSNRYSNCLAGSLPRFAFSTAPH